MQIKAFALLSIVLPLASCAFFAKSKAPDLDAAEDRPGVAEPLSFEPSADALLFRIDLVRGQKKEYQGDTNEPVLADEDYAVFGCYLGQGLAVDANGNVYLDPFKAFDVDPGADVTMRHSQDILRRESGRYEIRVRRDGVLHDETAASDGSVLTVKAGRLALRALQLSDDGRKGVCSRGMERDTMTASSKEIRVTGTSKGTRYFTRNGDAVELTGDRAVRVERRGDSFQIKVTEMFFIFPQSSVNYTLNLSEDRLELRRESRVILDLRRQPDGLYDKKGNPVFAISAD